MSPNVLWAAAATVIVLTSCSGPSTPEHAGPNPTHDSQSAEHNAADVSFARGMIPHHQQAVDMAAMVPSRSTNPDVRVMATHISSDQQAEILTMTGLLAQWGVQGAADHGDHSGMHVAGMVDGATLNEIQSARGSSFDALWMTSMISHHQGAITMAQTEIAHGQSSDAIELAGMIINAQQREIAQMNDLSECQGVTAEKRGSLSESSFFCGTTTTPLVEDSVPSQRNSLSEAAHRWPLPDRPNMSACASDCHRAQAEPIVEFPPTERPEAPARNQSGAAIMPVIITRRYAMHPPQQH